MEEEWKILIILDACRYDFFKKVHGDYFSGTLEKRRSKGSSTLEWLAKSFPGFYDLTYISANPFVNSLGLPLKKLSYEAYSSPWGSWRATQHFSKIVDVWRSGWDEKLHTVPPKEINKASLSHRDASRMIIHYMQPHRPYLSLDFHSEKMVGGRGTIGKTEGNDSGLVSMLFSYYKKRLQSKVENILGETMFWSIKKALNFYPVSSFTSLTAIELFWREGRIKELLTHYERNLRRVLEAVTNLIEQLDGKIIITSDHGEAFGEQGRWAHHTGAHIPALVNIPWFTVSQ